MFGALTTLGRTCSAMFLIAETTSHAVGRAVLFSVTRVVVFRVEIGVSEPRGAS